MAAFHGSSNYDTQVAALARRRKMAELLQQSALEGFKGPPAGLAKTSVFEPLGQMAKAFASVYSNKGLDDEEAALSAQRSKDIETLLDKQTRGTEVTVPGTLPHLPGVAPMTQEGAPVAPPVEGEPDLHQMLKTNLEAQTEQPGAATTGRIPLNKRDALANTMQLGEALGGTTGAAVTAKAIEAGIPSAKESKKTWVTGRNPKGEEVHGWADASDTEGPNQGFTPVGGAKPEKGESEKALDSKIRVERQTADFLFGDTMSPEQKDNFARMKATGEMTTVSGPRGPQTVSNTNAVLSVLYGGEDKVPGSVLSHMDAAMKPGAAPVAPTSPSFSPEPTAQFAPVNLPGVPGAEPAAAAPQPKMMPTQVDPAKIPAKAKQSEAQVLTEQLALEKGLLASGENGPDQQYIHERNIKQISERLAKIGALPPEATAAGATPPPSVPTLKLTSASDLTRPDVQAHYLKDDPLNQNYLPLKQPRGSITPPDTTWQKNLDDAKQKIVKDREAVHMTEMETARKSYENLMDKIAADPKSGVIRTVDPKTGSPRYEGNAPGMGLDQLIPRWIMSQDSQNAQSANKALDNIFTLMRSGLAVTNQEDFRKRLEFGTDWQFSPQTAHEAYGRFTKLLESKDNAILGQFPSVVRDYWHATKPEISGYMPSETKKASAGDMESRANAKLDDDVRKRANKFLTPGR